MLTFFIVVAIAIGVITGALVPFWIYSKKKTRSDKKD